VINRAPERYTGVDDSGDMVDFSPREIETASVSDGPSFSICHVS